MNEVPQLLVEWSSPWQEFVSAVGPALRRSPPPLSAEARAGLFPWRGILAASLVEIVAVLATAVVHPAEKTALAAVEEQPRLHDIIFFAADELPRTRDLGGAPTGEEGKSGGASVHHAVQTIKVARGQKIQERVLDAPELNLPKSDSAIKNLLSFKADVGPAPAEALPSSRRAVTLPMAVAPPPPELHDQLRRPQLVQQQVAPPPVELSAQLSSKQTLAPEASVVPPPVSAPPQVLSHRAQLTLPAEAVVAPRPDLNMPTRLRPDALGSGGSVAPPRAELNALRGRSLTGLKGDQKVAPPPVELSSIHGRSLRGLSGNQSVAAPPVDLQNLKQRGASSLASASVVPPPVEMNSGLRAHASLTGDGNVAPPQQTASAKPTQSQPNSAAVVLSPKPGDRAGQPAKPEPAILAMAPASNTAGPGGSAAGSGIAHGSAAGSSSAGSSSGAGFSGAGKSADASPHTGTSTYAGPGGAGDRYNGRVPGVSVSGGNNTITLPSFGPEAKASGRSDVHKNSNGITIVASPRAGGAMNYYGLLKGDRVYTIYFRTAAGMVSLQFADPDSAAHPYTEDLIAPQALRNELPSDIDRGHLVLKCVLDRSGAVKNVSILQSAGGEFEKQVLAALPDWKFSSAFRGSEPVEVNAILGFGVDTK